MSTQRRGKKIWSVGKKFGACEIFESQGRVCFYRYKKRLKSCSNTFIFVKIKLENVDHIILHYFYKFVKILLKIPGDIA